MSGVWRDEEEGAGDMGAGGYGLGDERGESGASRAGERHSWPGEASYSQSDQGRPRRTTARDSSYQDGDALEDGRGQVSARQRAKQVRRQRVAPQDAIAEADDLMDGYDTDEIGANGRGSRGDRGGVEDAEDFEGVEADSEGVPVYTGNGYGTYNLSRSRATRDSHGAGRMPRASETNPLELPRSPERARRGQSEEDALPVPPRARQTRQAQHGPQAPGRSAERSRHQDSPDIHGVQDISGDIDLSDAPAGPGRAEGSRGFRGSNGSGSSDEPKKARNADARVPGRTPAKRGAAPDNAFPQDDNFEDNRVPCGFCGRRFAPDRVATHEAACSKAKAPRTPKVFDPSAKRLADFEGDEQKLVHGSGPGRPQTSELGPSTTKAALRAPPARSASGAGSGSGGGYGGGGSFGAGSGGDPPARQKSRPAKAVPMFGDVKPNFNPVAEESSAAPPTVQSEAAGRGGISSPGGREGPGNGATGGGPADAAGSSTAATERRPSGASSPRSDSRKRSEKRSFQRREDSESSDRDRGHSSRRKHRRRRRDDRDDRGDRAEWDPRDEWGDRGARDVRDSRELYDSRGPRESREPWDLRRGRGDYQGYPPYGSAEGSRWGYQGPSGGPGQDYRPQAAGMDGRPYYDYPRGPGQSMQQLQPTRRSDVPPPQYATPAGPCNFCIYCGSKFFDGAVFCGSCGAKRFAFE